MLNIYAIDYIATDGIIRHNAMGEWVKRKNGGQEKLPLWRVVAYLECYSLSACSICFGLRVGFFFFQRTMQILELDLCVGDTLYRGGGA